MRLSFRPSLPESLHREIGPQLTKVPDTGWPLDPLNGHLNFHLHPTVFRILLQQATPGRIARMRLTRDPLGLNLRLGRGRWAYRLSHALIFSMLSRWAQPQLERQ